MTAVPSTGEARRARGQAAALLAALRPAEWTKNLFVFPTLVFSGAFDETSAVVRTTGTFVAFCAVSSAGYLLNDLRDVELDRAHPTKRFRPIASGELSERTATRVAVVLALFGLALALVIDPEVGAVVAGYGALTTAYTLVLKHMVILDVMTIAAGFLLRVLGGAVTVDVHPSQWLLICTGMLALFLGFTKRRQEAASELHSGQSSRPVLEHYSMPFLDQMVSMVTAGTVISYAIYAAESPLIGDRMLITTPLVLYGIFRYLYLIYHCGDTRSVATLVTRDPGMVAASVAWALTAILLLYV